MTQRTLAALIDTYRGKPILVIGGGPSVLPDLMQLAEEGFAPACVISANEHGTKQPFFVTDYIVNADKIHCMAKDASGVPISMRDYLAQFGLPTINRHSFADYRLADWTFSGNSGLTATVVAAALGGDPVVVTGIDCWQGGRHYFHDGYPGVAPFEMREEPPTHPIKPRPKHHTHGVGLKAIRNMPLLRDACAGANIRPCSGPLLHDYPKYSFSEQLPASKPTTYAKQAAQAQHLCTALKVFEFSPRDRVAQGASLALSERELRNLSQADKIAEQQVLHYGGKLR